MTANVNLCKGGQFASARRGGIDAWESAFIEQKRTSGVSDAAIAKMIGRAISDVQAVPQIIRLQPIPVPRDEPRQVVSRPPPKRKRTDSRTGNRKRWGPRDMPRRVQLLVAEIAERHKLRASDLIGDSRSPPICAARFEAFAMLREIRRPVVLDHSYSLKLIGSWFGGRDHTTVMSGIRTHWARVADLQVAA